MAARATGYVANAAGLATRAGHVTPRLDADGAVRRMPAIVCDVCGEQAYDEKAVEHLQRLLWANTPGQPSSPASKLT